MDEHTFTTMLDDLRVLQLDEVQRCRYFELLGLAVRCQAGGALRTKGGPLDLDLLSSRLKISLVELAGTLVVLTNAGLVDCQDNTWLVRAGSPVAAEPPVAAGDMRQYWRERKQQSRSNRRQATGQPVEAGEEPRLQDVKLEPSCSAGDNGKVKDMSMTVEDHSAETTTQSKTNGRSETRLADISSTIEDTSAEYEDMSAISEDMSAKYVDTLSEYENETEEDEDNSWNSEQAGEDSEDLESEYEHLSPELEFMFVRIIDMSVNYSNASDKPPLQTIATFVQELFPELFTAITTPHSALAASEPCTEEHISSDVLENVLDNVLDGVRSSALGNVFDMSSDTSTDMSADMSSDASAEMSKTGQENAQKRVIKLNNNIKLEDLSVCMTQNLPPNFVAAASPAESLPAPGFETSDFVAAASPAESLPAPGIETSEFAAAQAAIGRPAALEGSSGPPGQPRPQNSPAHAPVLLPAAGASFSELDIVQYLRKYYPDVDLNRWQEGGLRLLAENYSPARMGEIIRWAAENGIRGATLLHDLPKLLNATAGIPAPVFMPA